MRVVRAVCWVLAVLVSAARAGAGDGAETPTPTAWGKPVSGLQAGIRVKPGKPAPTLPHLPEVVAELEIVVRNIGDEAVALEHPSQTFSGSSVKGVVSADSVLAGGFSRGQVFRPKLAPGEVYIFSLMPVIRPTTEPVFGARTQLAPGRYRIGADEVRVRLGGAKESLTLGTGYLDFQMPPAGK